jgi:hypothetical protein
MPHSAVVVLGSAITWAIPHFSHRNHPASAPTLPTSVNASAQHQPALGNRVLKLPVQ